MLGVKDWSPSGLEVYLSFCKQETNYVPIKRGSRVVLMVNRYAYSRSLVQFLQLLCYLLCHCILCFVGYVDGY